MYRRGGSGGDARYYSELASPNGSPTCESPPPKKFMIGDGHDYGCDPRQKPGDRRRWTSSGMVIRVLLVLLCVETLYIISTMFSNTLICDDLRLNLRELKQDYERAQLVIETLTLSCNEADYEQCLQTVQKTQTKYLNARIDFAKKVKTISGQLEKCNDEKSLMVRPMFGPEMDPNALMGASVGSSSSSSLSSSSGDQNGDDQIWLTIGIPTVSRKDDVDYLSDTLKALVPHLPVVQTDPLFGRIQVVVMNNMPGDNIPYVKNREFYGNSQWADYFDFVDNVERETTTPQEAQKTQRDERKRLMELGSRPPKPPNTKVQQQTRDVVSLMRYALDTYQPSYYLFMEDDFEMCSNGIEVARYLINRATQYSNNWMAIRASFGLNGVFIHGEDLEAIASYLEKHQARRPPDHLTTEFLAGETPEAAAYKKDRTLIGFRYNIFNHIGAVSSLRKGSIKWELPGCWQELKDTIVFKVESFKPDICPSNDIWPCSWETEQCNPKYQLCFANGTKTLQEPPMRIPWELQATNAPMMFLNETTTTSTKT